MPTQVYECDEHGRFERQSPMWEPIPPCVPCPADDCDEVWGDWRPSSPHIIVKDGTGAGKESHHR